MCTIVVYVGDLLITGATIIQNVIKQLKTQVVMEDEPTPISKYQSVMHKVATYDCNPEIVTEVVFDVRVYIKSAVDDYVKRRSSSCADGFAVGGVLVAELRATSAMRL